MTQQRIRLAVLGLAIVSVIASGATAEARGRCRCQNGGWRQGYSNGYGYNTAWNGYNTAWNGNTGWNGNTACNGTQNVYTNTTDMNGSNMPANNVTVGRPTYADPAAPQQVVNPAPIETAPAPAPAVLINQQPNQVQSNSSPDPDNEGRNASKIPGTAPTKAPAPAANGTP